MKKDIVLVNTSVLCDLKGVTRESIRLWRLKGMPYEQYGPKTFRYDLEKVDEWMYEKYRRKGGN